jgi:hypothetical protein
MSGIKSIEVEVRGARDLALIGADDSVWLVVQIRWWDLATLVWWWFCPADRKAIVRLRLVGAEQRVSFPAVRVASRHMRVRGLYQ